MLIKKMKSLYKIENRSSILVLLSVFLSFIALFSVKINFSGSIHSDLNNCNFDNFKIYDLILIIFFSILLYLFLFCLYKFLDKNKIEEKHISPVVFFVFALILFLFWLPYLICYSPGIVLGDSLASISQALNRIYNNHHPVFYSLIVKVVFKIGFLFGLDINGCIMLYSIFQMLIMIGSVSYYLYWMINKGANRFFILAAIMYYCFFSCFPIYSFIMWKDPLFSAALLWESILVYDGLKNNSIMSKKSYLIKISVVSLLVCFLRNNGIYIIALSIIIFFLMYKKRIKNVLICMIVVLLFSIIIQGPVYNILKIYKDNKVESLGIPIQQIAYVISIDDSIFSDDDREILENIMPISSWKEHYRPCRVDDIKFNEDFNASYFNLHVNDFMTVWIKYLPRCIVHYTKSYCLATFGFWHPFFQEDYGYVTTGISENTIGIKRYDYTNNSNIVRLSEFLDAVNKFKIGSGTIFWITIILLGYIIYKKRYDNISFFLPSLICWFSIMIATPVAFSLRYVFILAIQLPGFFVVSISD